MQLVHSNGCSSRSGCNFVDKLQHWDIIQTDDASNYDGDSQGDGDNDYGRIDGNYGYYWQGLMVITNNMA